MVAQTVVVLGGGVGGLVVANELRKKLGREHRVVLVDREGRHIFTPSFLWLMTGDRRPEKIVRDLAPLERKGIELVKDDISVIDPVAKTIQVNGSTLEADYIVVSLGADLAPEQIPELAEAGLNLYTLDGATSIRDARLELRKGNLAIVVVRLPFKCPAAPYEAAMLLEAHPQARTGRRRIDHAVLARARADGSRRSGSVQQGPRHGRKQGNRLPPRAFFAKRGPSHPDTAFRRRCGTHLRYADLHPAARGAGRCSKGRSHKRGGMGPGRPRDARNKQSRRVRDR